MPFERFTSAFSNANGSIGLCLATLALIVVLTYGYLSFSDAVLAAEPIDLKARRPNLGYMTALEADYGRRILAAGRAWAIGEAEGCQVEDPRQQLQPCERWWPVARRRRGSRPR